MRSRTFRFPALIVACSLVLASPSVNGQSTAGSREDRWREDLQVFSREFASRQLDFAKLYPADRFAAEVKAIDATLAQSSDADVTLSLMRLVASANVAHTNVRSPLVMFHRLPLTFYWFSDGLAITAAAEAYREALGLHVAKIGTLSPAEIEAGVAPYIAHENDEWLHQQSPSFMVITELLQRLGAVEPDGRVAITLVKPDGASVVVRVTPGGTLKPPAQVTAADALNVPTALFRKHQDSYYWYEYLPEAKALYVQYNKCEDDPKQPFSAFAKEVFDFADAHPVDRVVVDLRLNGGGNSTVIKPLINGLRSRPQFSAPGRLYTLIGRGTFSSGLLAAMNFRDDLHAVLVGEPVGEKPNSYGEVRELKLPNSQVVVQYSTKFFRMVPNGDPLVYAPDLTVTRSLAEALAGRDPALEAALRHVVR
ncbi:MAG TPA: hypothetical protein VJN96_13620 [Vicinamibacterales bacterium]|nr:hypothetical protein [Vicinamibacterales bacterium]